MRRCCGGDVHPDGFTLRRPVHQQGARRSSCDVRGIDDILGHPALRTRARARGGGAETGGRSRKPAVRNRARCRDPRRPRNHSRLPPPEDACRAGPRAPRPILGRPPGRPLTGPASEFRAEGRRGRRPHRDFRDLVGMTPVEYHGGAKGDAWPGRPGETSCPPFAASVKSPFHRLTG